MDVRELIRALVTRLEGMPICDGCVADRLRLSSEEVPIGARELAGMQGFIREVDRCGMCGERGKVTSRR